MDDFIFVGPPTRKEILLYLKDKKYSLVNNPSLKYQIIFRHKMEGRSFFDVMNFNFVKKCKFDNFYIKKMFLFNDQMTGENIYRLLPFKNTEKNKSIINLYCRKEPKGDEKGKDCKMKDSGELIVEKRGNDGAVIEYGDCDDENTQILIAGRQINAHKNIQAEENPTADKLLKEMDNSIEKLNIQDGRTRLGYSTTTIEKRVRFDLEKNEVLVYGKREGNASPQNETARGRRVLGEITNRESCRDNAQIPKDKLLLQSDHAVEMPKKSRNTRSKRHTSRKSKDGIDLRKLTEKNTLLNSGYKTVIVKHSKRVNFLSHSDTTTKRDPVTKRKTKILVKFEQKDHIPPHNVNGIKPVLAKSPKLKKFKYPKGKKVVELKRTISVDFSPSNFEFERKNKKMRIE
ncbi:hypothetical protein THOM_0783 [Trachipleistophora hominis]|uniref:Uncharacterized protein n=1 Tax=Trachipleistophora hominis TaxID=72359 RepID=L7JZR4_TRAHO|nr:hypothetical protein THOM_0783 [Trachipleistophora hominis]